MGLTAIILLISIGLLLILIEFLVLPGTNVSGILGIVMVVAGIVFAYKDLGTPTAHYILTFGLILITASMIFILRSKTWQRISLNTNIEGKVENIKANEVNIGDKGKAVTRLAPIGTVLINNNTYEGKSGHSFIDPNTPIMVTKISGNQLLVKTIDAQKS